jgi:hypothetical protein
VYSPDPSRHEEIDPSLMSDVPAVPDERVSSDANASMGELTLPPPWTTHMVPATVVPPFLLSAILAAISLLDTLQGPLPPELLLSATSNSSCSVMPTQGTPFSTPIVAGMAPCERMMLSSLSAVWTWRGWGRPC